MKYDTKLALRIFIIGTIILSIGLYATYRYTYSTIIQEELSNTALITNQVSVNFGQQLREKIKTNQTLSIAPVLINALKTSNGALSKFSEKERNEVIYHLNEKWKFIKDENNSFILKYTDNKAAQFLKAQQHNLKGEYGEIFLTNKYGALVASTSKLTTLAHAHKYWWQGAYNNGLGTVFIDDRGYDDSVDGYVLGLVIPIKEDDQIIGMLKVNLNILGVISEMILSTQNDDAGDLKLIRSGGEIICEEGMDPLTTRISDLLYQKLKFSNEHSFLFNDSDKKWMIGKSEIAITSKDAKCCIFGGSFESKDHQKGNSGESWFIINYREIDNIIKPLNDSLSILLSISLLLLIILAFTAYIFGKTTIKPLKEIIDQSKKIGQSDFSGRVVVTRTDEIGLLGKSFNNMAKVLEKTTTSIKKLELSEHKILQQNEELQRLNATKDKIFSIIAHDLRSPFNTILGFSKLLIENLNNYKAAETEKVLGIINVSAKNTLTLLDNLLDWAKSQTGQVKFEPEKVVLSSIIHEIFGLLNPSAKSKNISLEYIPSHEIEVLADLNMIKTILRNLISNAIKFTNSDGQISVHTLQKDNFIEITVSDTGVGMNEKTRNNLFKLETNESTIGTANEKGSGLGLILCKEFVEKQGGKIWVESEEGKGSDFKFTLPLNKSK
ncbi:MAG: HAMP domain-containing sensor histidine kinase [Bacteroidales bacterium]